MNQRLLALLDAVEGARAELSDSLDRLGESLGVREELARPDVRLSDFDPVPGTELHERLIAGLERMHHAIAAARAETVRIMVDDEGLSISDVAKLMNRPRQLVSRLYRAASKTPSSR